MSQSISSKMHASKIVKTKTTSNSTHIHKAHINGETVNLCEFINNRLYFVTLSCTREPIDSVDTHYFTIDNELVYQNFLADFGPLTVSHLTKYFSKVTQKLNFTPVIKKIIHYTSSDPRKRANAAFLIASFAIIFLDKSPKEAYQKLLTGNNTKPFLPFQDASPTSSCYQLRLLECLEGLHKAHQRGLIRFDDFSAHQYDFFSSFKQGDLNWIVPEKIVAHSGPVTQAQGTTPYKPPQFYVKYFAQNNVSTIVRLNKKTYDARFFTQAGIDHKELYFHDGSCPTEDILTAFLIICETATGAVAVHCKAGLGRTGSLIGAYLMKHYRMNAKEAIAWMRIVRPGCVIGRQQTWLEDHEEKMWVAGDAFRALNYGCLTQMPRHSYGIYSILGRVQDKTTATTDDVPTKHIMSTSAMMPPPLPLPPLPRRASHHGQRGRKHAYVAGKTLSAVCGRSVITDVKETEEGVDRDDAEGQGEELLRVKAGRERWFSNPM